MRTAAFPGKRPISSASSKRPSPDRPGGDEGGLAATPDDPRSRRSLYGRRQGRPLKPKQRAALERLLPRLEVDASAGRSLDPQRFFASAMREVRLEIGFGAGEHLMAQALAHRDVGFVGVEPYLNGVARLVAAVEEHGLDNVRIFRDDARLLLDRLSPASLARVAILFPDPWPKARHHKRRIVSAPVLAMIERAMPPGAELRIATDHPGYLAWILERVLGRGTFEWLARRPRDWRERPADWPATRYEIKALAAGRSCAYLSFVRR
jgi:tRNA (guanine-N7-)-methyltransferase